MRSPSLRQLVLYLSVCLSLLFAVLEPVPTRTLPLGWAVLYWLAHIGSGLLLALLAAAWLAARPALRRWPAPSLLLLAGVLGSAAFAPLALGLEALFPARPDEMPPDDWLDHWEAAGGARALLAEWLQLLPSYLSAWMLINALPLVQLGGRGGYPDTGAATVPASAIAADEPVPEVAEPAVDGETAWAGGLASEHTPHAYASGSADAWLAQLPPAIGRQLLRIEADLHYLHVHTRAGRAMLLGSLATATKELGSLGLRVHRAHWVAIDQVRRLQRSEQGWQCELRDGTRVPISRRRVREVQERLGRDFVIAG